jgi:undecaprenyl-diphosphatase
MESLSEIVILAFVQGLSEFLPISSSGHLVIVQKFLGISEPRLILNVLLHLGTLIAVLLFLKGIIVQIVGDTCSFILKKRAFSVYVKIGLFAIIGCFPAFIAVFFFKDFFMSFFLSPQKIAVLLILNGLILLLSKNAKAPHSITLDSFSLKHALIIGCVQPLAILPGISRSGTTITCGLLLGLEPLLAFKFSFLLAIPAILGAVVLEGKELFAMDLNHIRLYGLGLVLSFVSGFFALAILKKFVAQNRLHTFSLYCITVGISFLVYFVIKN